MSTSVPNPLPSAQKPKASPMSSAGLSPEEIKSLLRQDVRSDFNRISNALEDFHGIFYQMWDMGHPYLTFQIPTACVTFDRDGEQTEFWFNPIFWKKLDLYTKAFIVAHEVLHAMLNHGIRIKNCPLRELANKALDIVVNHMLLNKFGFNRASIDLSPMVEGILDENGVQIPHRNERGDDIVLCWIDTVFGSLQGEIKRNKPFEYYYAKLEQNVTVTKGGRSIFSGSGEGVGGTILDDHDFLKPFGDKEVQDIIINRINERLSDEEKEIFDKKVTKSEEGKAAEKVSAEEKNSAQAGSMAGQLSYRPNGYNIRSKRKWETVIKKWCRRHMSKNVEIDHWAFRSRRLPKSLTTLDIPGQIDFVNADKQKVDVVFYQDFSGSCFHLKDRFFKAAASLPKDRFNVVLKCFDTECHFVDPNDPELTGGGGTSFSILENDIQVMIKDGKIQKYPDAVFVITDGYASDQIVPQYPEKWYFFLSTSYRDCLPKTSNILSLTDYE